MEVDDDGEFAQEQEARRQAEVNLRRTTHVVTYPGGQAGAPILEHSEQAAPSHTLYQSSMVSADANAAEQNPYAPFATRIDWEVARWAKMRGPGSTAVTELLQIEGLTDALGLSFRTSAQLNAIIDNHLPSARPRFVRREVVIGGESFEFFVRDIIACTRALFGDPKFVGVLVLAPEQHYKDEARAIRVYFDMHTGDWWWCTQEKLEARRPGATVIPIIIASDKTQLTLFGSKTAYPVYMTIGNLPKEIRRKPSRRGQILLAYIPSTRLEHVASAASRRRMLANLYHVCLKHALAPLKKAGIDGIRIARGDGVLYRGHPIFAVHIGDYLEQILATGVKSGECPKCPIPRDEIGNQMDARELRQPRPVLDALALADDDPREFARACACEGVKPIRDPYWADLPYVHIYRSITPDILHQLYQGVIKHLLAWLKKTFGPEELDARCRRFPPNHHVRLFLQGITKLQRVPGKVHADICRFLLGLVVGLPIPGGYSSVRLVRAVRALLDFLYLAQYPAHTTETLMLLKNCLVRFHQNKDIFKTLGIRLHFKLPKLHSLDHYPLSITLFGTTDNYDTQNTERLHIDFAKDAYRATNRRNEFHQMTLWLERREKVLRHDVHVRWRLGQLAANEGHRQHAQQLIHITKNPSVKAVTFAKAAQDYGALYLRDALARFIVRYQHPTLTDAEVERALDTVVIRFRHVPVYHRMKFILEDAQELGIMEDTRDAAHARPQRKDKQGRPVPGRFDTVLANEGDGGEIGVHGYRVGRIRMLFRLPKRAVRDLFRHTVPPGHLAYVEWFTAFTQPDPVHGLYRVSRCRGDNGERLASVIDIRDIQRSCHLYPVFPPVVPRHWTHSNVLDECDNFYVSPYSDMHMFMTLL
ncbi:hypothetical protein K466DRAFT_505729 [Polyporus arcularius HHB13444]|uniref:CxC2-like cysteine cluster KDZ transposase-associated domain-containing protein n=1 Tax=Polyporus arcularius HHB13444 TaxID=1314778 RepID=A0A5C3NNU8_9APHY|nr:hypothetical protein K466DRAFT_505729 [Polyporus arcularius HHB13444]